MFMRGNHTLILREIRELCAHKVYTKPSRSSFFRKFLMKCQGTQGFGVGNNEVYGDVGWTAGPMPGAADWRPVSSQAVKGVVLL